MSWERTLCCEMLVISSSFPGGSDGKESACSAGDPGLIPRVRKMPWRKEWQSTPAFLPEESHGQRSLVGYNPQGCKMRDDWATGSFHLCIASPLFPCSGPNIHAALPLHWGRLSLCGPGICYFIFQECSPPGIHLAPISFSSLLKHVCKHQACRPTSRKLH